jgi:hypothetical protein
MSKLGGRNRNGLTLRFSKDELMAIQAAASVEQRNNPKHRIDTKILAKALVLQGTGFILKHEMEQRKAKETPSGTTIQQNDQGNVTEQQLPTDVSGEVNTQTV